MGFFGGEREDSPKTHKKEIRGGLFSCGAKRSRKIEWEKNARKKYGIRTHAHERERERCGRRSGDFEGVASWVPEGGKRCRVVRTPPLPRPEGMFEGGEGKETSRLFFSLEDEGEGGEEDGEEMGIDAEDAMEPSLHFFFFFLFFLGERVRSERREKAYVCVCCVGRKEGN